MSKIKNVLSTLKGSVREVYSYFKTLPLYGKVIFVVILAICKIGPDFIMFPLLMKWVRKHSKRTEN